MSDDKTKLKTKSALCNLTHENITLNNDKNMNKSNLNTAINHLHKEQHRFKKKVEN